MMYINKLLSIFFLMGSIVLFTQADDINNTTPVLENSEEKVSELPSSKLMTATRSDIRVIEASEDIVYISQKLVKDYLFLYSNPININMKRELKVLLIKLNDNLKTIARTTKNEDTKDLLEYLAYSKDEISEILNKKMGEEENAMMLDYSETLLEGANSILNAHQYDFTDEEKMYMVMKKMKYLFSRITKYYLASNLGFNSTENKEEIKNVIISIEETMEKINLYSYPNDFEVLKVQMDKSWNANKIFFTKPEGLFIPNLIVNVMNYLEDMVAQLALYHSKNQ